METQKAKEKVGETIKAKMARMANAEKMEKAKTKAKSRATSLQKLKKDATKDNIVNDITAC